MSKASTPRINKIFTSMVWEVGVLNKSKNWLNLRFFYFFYFFFISFYTQLNVGNLFFWNYNFFNKFFIEAFDINGFYNYYYQTITSLFRNYDKVTRRVVSWTKRLYKAGTSYIFEWNLKLFLISVYLKGSIVKYQLENDETYNKERFEELNFSEFFLEKNFEENLNNLTLLTLSQKKLLKNTKKKELFQSENYFNKLNSMYYSKEWIYFQKNYSTFF